MFLKNKIKKNKRKNNLLDPEHIFIDAKNLPKFDADKFEGVLEKPLDKYSFLLVIGVFLLIMIIFLIQTFNLQIIKGESYQQQSRNNFIKTEVLFSDRGIISDRNNIPLVWNKYNELLDFSERRYTEKKGFSHLLGFLSYPQKDASNNYFSKEHVGRAGVESYFNDKLNGKLGSRVFRVDAFGRIFSDNIISLPTAGENITLSIDSRIQEKLSVVLQEYLEKHKFNGGAGIIMNVNNGEIIAMTSLPEYNSNILTAGTDRVRIAEYINNKNKPFLNKTTYAEFTPGSIMKPFVALAALQEKIITPYQKIHTDGVLIIPNPWYPDKPSYFRDWKNHGPVDLFSAIANSSNIYFYKIGGGFEDMKGLGIDKIYSYLSIFGFGQETNIEGFPEQDGNIPNRDWKKKTFGANWLLGDTYYTAIGQYGFLVTPMQAAVGVAAIANNGKILQPVVLKNSRKIPVKKEIKNIDLNHFATMRTAMRATVTRGTTQSLNLPFVQIASKSGTAQTRNRQRENSWVIGFWPYKNPQYAFVLMAEDGPNTTTTGVSRAASELFKWMYKNELNEYFVW